MFVVSDGRSFSQRFRKRYHRSPRLITFLLIYNTPLLLKIFHRHNMFEGIVSWFLNFFNGMVSVYVSEIVIVEFYVLRPFQRYLVLFCSSNIR